MITKQKLALLAIGASALLAQASAQNAATTVSVDANANRHAISPGIYGVCYADAHDMATLNPTFNRWGGNSTSRYNWQIDAHSAGSDWYFETYSDGSGTPSGSADAFLNTTRSAANGAEPMFTIPLIDYIANLGNQRSTLEGFSVRKYGAQKATDPYNSDAGNGVSLSTGKNVTGNDPLDTGVANSASFEQGWVQHFVSTFGASTTSTGVKYYLLDNEPSLWNSTHRDVHPNPTTYDELFNKIVAYATAIRQADPQAKICGPEEWGWSAMYFSGLDQANGTSSANSDYNTHGQMYYYPWLLKKIQDYKTQTGIQLIDVLTVHGYNQTPDGSDDSASAQQVRNRETRILWDPNFSDPSWYGDLGINGRVLNWISTLKTMVSQYCPGLQIGFTEYNWGDEANLNGATTQADVLGIYGREGLDFATRWTIAKNTNTSPTTYYVTYLASQIYRNYDGNSSTFGDTSVSATVPNPDNLSAFAAVRSSDGALTVMVINKQTGSTPVTVNLANFSGGSAAQAWQINSASQTAIAHLADVPVSNNSFSTTVPSQSITLFVVPSSSSGVSTPPTSGGTNTGPVDPNARLTNISTRSFVGTGGDVQIAGFVIGGGDPKQVIIRASGPALTQYGVTGVLADPYLELHQSGVNGVLASNDDWDATTLRSAFQAAGIDNWAVGSKDAAMLVTLPPGGYTAIVSGKNGGTGIALIEVFEVSSSGTSKLINISTRSVVQTGANAQIAGFIISGSGPKTVLIRASGPALTQYGVPNVLNDPTLEIHANGVTAAIASNDDWDPSLKATFQQLNIDNWATGSKDAAITLTLAPGGYTAIVSGKNGATGAALIEVFELP